MVCDKCGGPFEAGWVGGPQHRHSVPGTWPRTVNLIFHLSLAAAAARRFETFDVPALHIGVQAVLALYASWAAAERQTQQVRVPGLGRSLRAGGAQACH